MTDNIKKILTVVCILILLTIASLYLVIRSESAKITTFEECEKAGWLVRSIKVYDSVDGYGSIEKECVLWSGKHFVKQRELMGDEKRAVEIAIAPLSYPVTIIEVKKLECQGCFSVKLQRDDNQRLFTIVLDNWEIKSVVQSDNVSVLPAPFFPTQKEPATSYMAALLSDKPEELIINDGCLRAGGYLLVWPYNFSLSTDKDGVLQIINSTGQPVARVGDKVRIGGGADETPDGRVVKGYSAQLPNERCSGPYWIVGEVITVDKSASPVATTPPRKPETSGFEEKMLVVGGTWAKDGWKLSIKAVDKTAAPYFILISLSYQDKKLEDAKIATGKSYTYKGKNPDGSEVPLFTIKNNNIFVGASADAVRLALNWSVPSNDVQIIEAPVESDQMKTETPAPTPTVQASPEAPGFGLVLGIIGVLAVWRRLKK